MIISMLLAASVGGGTMALVSPQVVSAKSCPSKVLLFPTWYRGVVDQDCNIKQPTNKDGALDGFVWKIALNVVEMAMVAVGYVAVGYLIYGGFQYMIATGVADRLVAAKKTIINAVVGLVISFLSIAVINIIMNNFKV